MPVGPRKELSDVNDRITAPVTQPQEAGAESGNTKDQSILGGSRASDVQESDALFVEWTLYLGLIEGNAGPVVGTLFFAIPAGMLVTTWEWFDGKERR
jgi:hypothetical protein